MSIILNLNTIFFIASGVGLSPLYCRHFWPIVAAPDDRWGWLWSNWWNEDWQGKPKYSEKTAPAPLCPPEIPLDQTRDRTRAAAVTSTLGGGEWSASHSSHFTSEEKSPSTHGIVGCLGPRGNLDAMEKRISYFRRVSNPWFLGRPFRSLVTIPTELSWQKIKAIVNTRK
jgi:hypothetical protein